MEHIKNTGNLEYDMGRAATTCIKLAVSRQQRYGNSVDIVKDDTLIDLVLMKLIRTRELPKDDPKRYDEVIDSVNYLLFLLMRGQNDDPASSTYKIIT